MYSSTGSERSTDLVPYLLNRAVGAFNDAWLEQLRGHGVTIARWQLLAILGEYDGARLGQLAEMSGTKQSTATRVVDQMERDGLVRRHADGSDGRAVEIRLTPAGRRLLDELQPEAVRLVDHALAGLDDAENRALMNALTTVMSNLVRTVPDPQSAARP